MIYKIENLGQYGIIDDVPSFELPDNAFSSGQNIRCADTKVAKVKGYQTVFGDPITVVNLTLTGIAPVMSILEGGG